MGQHTLGQQGVGTDIENWTLGLPALTTVANALTLSTIVTSEYDAIPSSDGALGRFVVPMEGHNSLMFKMFSTGIAAQTVLVVGFRGTNQIKGSVGATGGKVTADHLGTLTISDGTVSAPSSLRGTETAEWVDNVVKTVDGSSATPGMQVLPSVVVAGVPQRVSLDATGYDAIGIYGPIDFNIVWARY